MLGVWLDENLDKRLGAIAEKTQRSKTSLAKEALHRYLEAEEGKQPINQPSIDGSRHTDRSKPVGN